MPEHKEKRTLTVLVSCEACGIIDAHAYVPERKEGQDIAQYMRDVVTPAVSEAHRLLSPDCHPETLSNIKIPIAEGQAIGFADPDREGKHG